MVEIFLPVFTWWAIVELVGLAILPLCLFLFRNLPDRGYAFAKPLGLILVSYLFWLAVSFHFLANTWPSIFLTILTAAVLAYAYFPKAAVLNFWRENRGLIFASELLFGFALLLWALVRAYNPEITATEKPMEMAFLNSTLRSEHFPPQDPWLSGYAISYYHFGYVIMAMLIKLSGVSSGVGFNLGIALLFALTMLGAFGLGYNLVAGHRGPPNRERRDIFYGLVAALFVTVIGNLEGVLEVAHTGRFIQSPEFWDGVDIKNLGAAPVTGEWLPTDNWWWWRASRVIHDSFLGQDMEVIDEFPFFSFLLADMHPHLLALPFTLLALGLAYNLLRSEEKSPLVEMSVLWVAIGGLGFLNSWDLPTYGLIVSICYGLSRYGVHGKLDRPWLNEWLGFTLRLAVGSLLLYLPFWIGFRSQAGGLVPEVLVKTRLHQYLIMFGFFIFIFMGFLSTWIPAVKSGLSEAMGLDRPPAMLGWGLVIIGWILALACIYLQFWLLAFFSVLIPLTVLAFSLGSSRLNHTAPLDQGGGTSQAFALLLFLVGLLLTMGVEFVYIRDVFGTRMNTVFKFYYQAWVLFAIASAYALAYLAEKIINGQGVARALGRAWQGGFAVLLGASLVYPLFATYSKTSQFKVSPTLDGTAFLQFSNPDDYQAVQWLNANTAESTVILEASGGSYTYYNRVSAYTGRATLLGWGGHELQWRGNYDEPGRREPLIDKLYTSWDQEELRSLLEEFNIQYVYVGSLEQDKYGPDAGSLERWGGLMEVVYENQGVVILGRVAV